MTRGPAQIDPEVGRAFFGSFADMRPVQKAAAAALSAGRHAIVSAGTGSGKTEAVVAPLINRYRHEAMRTNATFLVYVIPTKALINDLHRRLTGPLQQLGLRLAIRHGDHNDLKTAPPHHVLLTTPESLAILITERHPLLTTLRAVVLDEVHLLYNNQRGQMTAILLHRLNRIAAAPLQVAAISATVGSLDDVRRFFLGEAPEAELLAFTSTRSIDASIRTVGSPREVATLAERAMQLPRCKMLLFANSRREVEELAAELKQTPALEQLVVTHHSSLAPEAREAAERRFGGEARAVCVSTSTLELGIDIGDIDVVLLYGPTSSMESLLQRIGRGNRRSNKTNAICLARHADGSIREAAVFSTMVGLATQGAMPHRQPALLYGAVLQQCLCKIVQENGGFTRVADIAAEVSYRPDIDTPAVEAILAELVGQGIVQRHGFQNRYGANDGLWELRDRHLIWGNFPMAGQTIDVSVQGRAVGVIPRANLMRINRNDTFVLGGNRYRVKDVIPNAIRVEPAPGQGANVPLLFGEHGPDGLDAFIGNALWRWLFDVTWETSHMTPGEWERVAPVISGIRAEIDHRVIPYVRATDGIRYFTFAGKTVNRVILAAFGHDPKGAGDIALKADRPIDWTRLPVTTEALSRAAEACFTTSNRQTLFQQYLPAEMQRIEWREEWLKDRDIDAVLSRLQSATARHVPAQLLTPLVLPESR
jgi:ATP-dependent Lhr-like helicase